MRRPSPTTWILVGLLAGALAGIAANKLLGPDHPRVGWVAKSLAAPVGEVFLRLLFMIVVPIVFCSLVLGVAGLGGARGFGRVGLKTLLWFVAGTAAAAGLGIALVNVFDPGASMGREVVEKLVAASAGDAQSRIEQAKAGTGFGIQTFVNLVPRNPIGAAAQGDMLPLIVFALLFGLAAGALGRERTRPLLDVLQSTYDVVVKILGYAMKLAPFGVAGLIFDKTALFGTTLLGSLAAYLGVALSGLAIQLFVVIGLMVWLAGRIPPLEFFARCKGLMATAFSTSSSNATLPTTLRTAREEFGVPDDLAGFVMPLGATLNMNGTALFEGVAVLFLAQVSGLDLSVGQQALVVVLAVLTAIGAAGVPGGSLPLLVVVLQQVGIEASMLAVILGVDRIVDMARTVPNVVGDVAVSICVARSEGRMPAELPSQAARI